MVVFDLSETGVLVAVANRWWRFTPTTSILTPFGLRRPKISVDSLPPIFVRYQLGIC